jgi:hypothetical protein
MGPVEAWAEGAKKPVRIAAASSTATPRAINVERMGMFSYQGDSIAETRDVL